MIIFSTVQIIIKSCVCFYNDLKIIHWILLQLQVVSRLKTDIEQFKSSYMILPGQMNDAITRLQRIYDKATSVC